MKKLRAPMLGAVLVSMAVIGNPSFAAVVDAQAGEITSLYTYSEYGGGDVIVTVQLPNGNCAAGYWLRMSDAGAKTMYAQLLSAYHAKARLRIQGHDDQIWGGSGGRYCRIYAVGNVP